MQQQQQSHSSFFTQMVEAYGPSGKRPFTQRNHSDSTSLSCNAEQFRPPSEMNARPRTSPTGAHSCYDALSDIQQRLKSIQGSQLHPQPEHFMKQSNVQYEGYGLPNPQSNIQQVQRIFPPAVHTLGAQKDRSPFSAGISPMSSSSLLHGEPAHAKNNAPCNHSKETGANCNKYKYPQLPRGGVGVGVGVGGVGGVGVGVGVGDDDALTPQEMAYLRVVEFGVLVEVSAQLAPGAALVPVCDQATVKLFPRHLVLLRPDGVAAVELVLEELCELNEDEDKRALDCIVQLKSSTKRQLIRIVCADELARGAIFKLLSARRSQQELTKEH